MVAGVFAGSLLWWALVVALVSRGRRALGPQARRWIDRLSGLALGALGAVELRRAL
jgi:threonine/homoserine/homoserine lactone efflux protein